MNSKNALIIPITLWIVNIIIGICQDNITLALASLSNVILCHVLMSKGGI